MTVQANFAMTVCSTQRWICVLILPIAIAFGANLGGCAASELEFAKAEYKNSRSHDSLVVLEASIEPGMSRTEVDELLGEPDYSPIDGQYYYLSDREAPIPDAPASQPPAPVGLVLDYRNDAGQVTQSLHSKRFGPIGE